MLKKFEFQKVVVCLALILHIGWIANHMRLTYLERINPWRLGGYAMYTVPTSRPIFSFYDITNNNSPILISNLSISLKKMNAASWYTNRLRSFRCYHLSENSLRSFFQENLSLINRNLVIEVAERKFIRNPPWFTRALQGRVEIVWENSNSFKYRSEFCGDEIVGKVLYVIADK